VWDERLQEKLHRETFYDEGGPIRTYMRGPVMYATTTRPVLTPVGDLRNGLRTVVDALDEYLEAKGRAKAMHDLVAAACVVEPSICTFKTCKVYREKGAWGAEPVDTSDTSISVAIDLEKFCAVLAT
jgi:inosine-uridine nucleoside N-ribohydrolase